MSDLAFRITESGKAPREIPIEAGLTIGRKDDNGFVIKDPKMSGRHAHVVEADGGLAIEDLGSANSTHVVGGPVLGEGERHLLDIGTAIKLGDTKIVVVTTAADEQFEKTVAARVIPMSDEDGGSSPGMPGLAELAAFKTARPRLVICNEAIKKIVDIGKVSYMVGRKGDAVDCAIEHPAVSSNHAVIQFEDRRFFLEDQGSRNGTHLDGEMLAPSSRLELQPDSHIRFGSIDALFVVDCDANGRERDRTRVAAAVELLSREGKVTRLQREKAEQEARSDERHVGEKLLENGFITVEQWVEAMKRAELRDLPTAGGRGRNVNAMLMLFVAILIALVLILILKREWLGL